MDQKNCLGPGVRLANFSKVERVPGGKARVVRVVRIVRVVRCCACCAVLCVVVCWRVVLLAAVQLMSAGVCWCVRLCNVVVWLASCVLT